MTSPFACDMSALTSEERARHHALAQKLRPAVLEFTELPDGYAARLPSDPAMVLCAAEFITLERLCCPFFTLALEVENDRGPLWMRITGREGIKPFIRAEFSIGSE
jgi:hypothetical protein